MLVKERQNRIVDMVNQKGFVKVKDLSEIFDVTEDSIRKDLTILEKRGLLKKTYGGAERLRVNSHELYVSQRIGKNIDEKQAIAREAMKLINEGEMIFLDISTSNLELIKLILEAGLKITVVTNMIDIMLSFTAPTETNLVFIGGKLNRERDGFVGSISNKRIKEFKFDKAFIGAVGVDINKNKVYTYTIDDALTKQTVMETSDKTYLMMENKKFASDGNYRYADIADFNGMILDCEPNEEIKLDLEKQDIELFYER